MRNFHRHLIAITVVSSFCYGQQLVAGQNDLPGVPPSVVGQAKPYPKPVYKINESNTVIATPGSTEIVNIGIDQLNRIVVDGIQRVGVQLSSNNATVDADHNVIAISTSQSKPISMFVWDADNKEGRSISLTLIPQGIPGKEILLKTNTGSLAINTSGTAKAYTWEKSSPYLTVINRLVKGIASGVLPDGYQMTEVPMGNLPGCRQAGIKFDFEKTAQTIVGGSLIAHVGTARNVTGEALEFVEDSCGEYGVIAVSSYPSPVIEPGRKIEVFVINEKEKSVSFKRIRSSLVE